MVSSAEILAAFRELSNSKQLDRTELLELLQDGIMAALAKKYGPTVQAEVTIDEGRGDIKIVSEQFQNTTIVLKNGDDVTGRLVDETADQLVLVSNQLGDRKNESWIERIVLDVRVVSHHLRLAGRDSVAPPPCRRQAAMGIPRQRMR